MNKFKKIIGVLIVFIALQISIAILQSHAADEAIFTGVDISKNGDGSVIAKLSQDQTTLTISGTGEMKDFSKYNTPWYSNRKKIKKVVIGQGITNIGDSAFYGCSSLSSVGIPSSVTSIEDSAFDGCSSLSSVGIPSSVTSIGSFAFYGCSSLSSIELPSSVTSIGYNAFSRCSSLSSINVDNENTEYTSIEGVLFNKENTQIIRYPEGRKEKKYSIPSSVTSIGYNAFSGCSSLSSVELPSSVTSIGNHAFSRCSNLESIELPSSVTSIGNYAFYGCSSLRSIELPSSVTSIESGAFSSCNLIITATTGEIAIPEILLRTMDENDILKTTKEYTLTNCTISENKDKIKIDRTINSTTVEISIKINDGALSGLTIIIIPKQEDISKNGDGSVIAEISEDLTILTISGTGEMKDFSNNNTPWYSYVKKIKKVVIGQGVMRIGDYAFFNCSSLASIELPSSVTSIGNYAFYECSSLASIELPSSVTSIGNHAFSGCSSLSSVELPSSVGSIGYNAFYGCSSLSSVELPSSVTSIGSGAFSGCSSISSINVDNENTKYTSIEGVLFNKGKTQIIEYPGGRKEESYNIPSSITSIGSYAFYRCSSLSSVGIPSSVTSIGDSAFNGCSSLSSVGIPSSVTSIGSYAFSGCSSLRSIELPSSVMGIGDCAFNGCSSLRSIELPSSVTRIGDYAFNGCSSLASIELPSSVTSIGNKAFSECSSLASIELPSSVTSIGDYAFSGCSSLASIEIPSSVTSIGKSAFYRCKLTIAVSTGEEVQEIMPNILARTLDENDILHTTKEFTLTNCEMNEAKDKIKVNVETASKKEVSIKINDGALSDLTVVVVPSGTITYNTTDITVNDVISTLYVAEGETITNNDRKNTHIFTDNGEFTYTYVTAEGEEKTATAKVNNIIKLESKIYNIDNNTKIISNIQPQTSVETFKNEITTNVTNVKIMDSQNKEVDSSKIIGTGMKVSLNGIASFTLIVTGDTNGDGQANIKDILQINKHRLNKAKLTNEYFTAGDVNKDDKVEIRDILQINKYRLGKISNL